MRGIQDTVPATSPAGLTAGQLEAADLAPGIWTVTPGWFPATALLSSAATAGL